MNNSKIQIQSSLSISRGQAWLYAARPKTLTTAIVPVMVSTALAHGSLLIAFSALMAILCMQVGTNLINDALDYKLGADTSERIGPQRMTQSGVIPFKTIYRAGILTFILSLLCAMPLIFLGGWPIAFLVVISIAAGYLYTGGPFPLSYNGLGDLFVFLFFGLAGTLGVFYIQTHEITPLSVVAAIQIGLLATVLIAINNLRDWKTDAKVNKRTLPVRFGPNIGKLEITLLIAVPYVLTFIWYIWGYTWASTLPWLTIPLALFIIRKIWASEPSKEYNQYLGLASLLHLSFGLCLAIGVYNRSL